MVPAASPSMATGRDHERARGQRLEAVLGADGHRQAPVEDVLDELHHHELLLEDREHRADRLDGVEGRRHARRAADEDVVGLAGRGQLAEGLDAAAHDGVERGVAAARAPAPGSARVPPRSVGGQVGRGRRPARRRRCRAGRSTVRFSTAPSDSTTTSSARRGTGPTSWTERMVAVSWRGAHHDGGVVGEVGQQAARAPEQVLDLAVDVGEELAHLLALCGPERPGRAQVVDEEPVALVGGDPAGAGVGLGQVAVALEGRHLAAHRGRRDLDPGVAGDVGRADRLGRLDVLRHHGVQDGRLAVVELGVGLGRSASGVLGPAPAPGARRCLAGCRVASGVVSIVCSSLRLVRSAWSWSWQSSLPSATVGPDGWARAGDAQSSRRRAEMKASWGTSTRPMDFIFFLPSFWRSRSLRLRVMSPP